MPKETQRPETIGDRTYRRIRTDILFGRLAPSERLALDRMREAYEASVSTLREMLSRLSSEGLVVSEGSRGFQVTPVSAANLREVAAMRCLLETHALRLSFEAGDMDWEGGVVAAHHKAASMERRMRASERSQHAEAWKNYDREFHGALIAACGSEVLLATHSRIYDQYLRYQMIAVAYFGNVAVAESWRLLESALARDWKTAQTTLAGQVQSCVTFMIDKRLVR
jgi:DNA-binding GntR family transcriptional regulator